MKLPNPCTQRKLAEAQDLPPLNEPFAAINVGFHKTYTGLVEQVLAQLGESIPVIVVMGDGATLLCDGGEQREQVIPARYHELKALAHLAFGVQLTLMANGSGRLTELTADELHEKRAQIREAQAAANTSSPTPTVTIASNVPAELLCHVRTLIDKVLSEGVVDFDRLQENIRVLASHALETAQLAVASNSKNCTRSSDGGAAILARGVGPACTLLSAAPISRDIGRQHASTSDGFSTRSRATALNGKIGSSTAKVCVTSILRSTCSRDTSLISGPRIFYSATGGAFKRTFLRTPPMPSCANSFRKCTAAQVAHIGDAHTEKFPRRCER
jgi:hypothetical protein